MQCRLATQLRHLNAARTTGAALWPRPARGARAMAPRKKATKAGDKAGDTDGGAEPAAKKAKAAPEAFDADWHNEKPSLLCLGRGLPAAAKVAALDLDGTLIEWKAGVPFSLAPDSWEWFNPRVPRKLKARRAVPLPFPPLSPSFLEDAAQARCANPGPSEVVSRGGRTRSGASTVASPCRPCVALSAPPAACAGADTGLGAFRGADPRRHRHRTGRCRAPAAARLRRFAGLRRS